MKIYVIAAQHGDEVFGLKIVSKIQEKPGHAVGVCIANPEAIARKKRFIETDMNRSYNIKHDSSESRLARQVEYKLHKAKPDLIIDIHTSHSNVSKTAIIAEVNSLTLFLANHLKMDAIVLIPEKLTKSSLIGRFRSNSISIEFGKNHRSDKLALQIADAIVSLAEKKSPEKIKNTLPIFEVMETIPKDFEDLKHIQNLKFNSKLNGYPFLAGIDTYETIGGYLTQLHKI